MTHSAELTDLPRDTADHFIPTLSSAEGTPQSDFPSNTPVSPLESSSSLSHLPLSNFNAEVL